jgi:hypothetical protein
MAPAASAARRVRGLLLGGDVEEEVGAPGREAVTR